MYYRFMDNNFSMIHENQTDKLPEDEVHTRDFHKKYYEYFIY